MENITVQRDDERDLSFEGKLIAVAQTSPNNACSDYSGSPGRWTELYLYKTRAGQMVCWRAERTQWQGERDQHEGKVCMDADGVVAFFGAGRLAKELYDSAGIDAAEHID